MFALTHRWGCRAYPNPIVRPAQRPNPVLIGIVVPAFFQDSDAPPAATPVGRLADAAKCQEVLRGGSHSSCRPRSRCETLADRREFHRQSPRRRRNRHDSQLADRVSAPVTYNPRSPSPNPLPMPHRHLRNSWGNTVSRTLLESSELPAKNLLSNNQPLFRAGSHPVLVSRATVLRAADGVQLTLRATVTTNSPPVRRA